MLERPRLKVIIAVALLLVGALLLNTMMYGLMGRSAVSLLFLGAFVLIVWSVVSAAKEPFDYRKSLKALVISYVAASVTWAALRIFFLLTAPPSVYAYWLEHLGAFTEDVVLGVIPTYLFSVAVSVMGYGILKVKLKPIVVFISSWYASLYVLVAFVEWSLYHWLQLPYNLERFSYLLMTPYYGLLGLGSLVAAYIFTVVYGRILWT